MGGVRSKRLMLCPMFLFLGFVAGVYAEGGEAGAKALSGSLNDSSGWSQPLGFVVVFLLVLSALFVMFAKYGGMGGLGTFLTGGGASRKLQIEESRRLGHGQFLVVAEYEGRRMLLGVCPGRIDYLCPLESEVLAESGVPSFKMPSARDEQASDS